MRHDMLRIIEACKAHDVAGQRRLYKLYFGYAMSIALRYSGSKSDAEEIINDAFVKVFIKIKKYDEKYPFKYWFRRIIINSAIDHHRKFKSYKTVYLEDSVEPSQSVNIGWENLKYNDVIVAIQQLPNGYRRVFNLYAVDGYKHHEIATLLGISVSTSKTNYMKGKQKLQKILIAQNDEKINHG